MKKTQTGFPVGLGIPTILMIFIILCLTSLGVLSLTSANSDSKLTDKTEAALIADYQAEQTAEQILSEIDGCLLLAASDTAVWRKPVFAANYLMIYPPGKVSPGYIYCTDSNRIARQGFFGTGHRHFLGSFIRRKKFTGICFT